MNYGIWMHIPRSSLWKVKVRQLHMVFSIDILNHCGAEALEKMLLSQIEELVIKALQRWSSQPSVEVKHAASVLSSNFPLYRLIFLNVKGSFSFKLDAIHNLY